MSEDVVERAQGWIDHVTPMPLSVHFYAADEILEMVTGLVAEVELLRSVQGLSVNIPEYGEWGSETLLYLFQDFGIQPGDGYHDVAARHGDLLREVQRARDAEHDPGRCFHCTRCADADDSQREALRAEVAESSYRAGQRDAEVGQFDPEFGR